MACIEWMQAIIYVRPMDALSMGASPESASIGKDIDEGKGIIFEIESDIVGRWEHSNQWDLPINT